MKLTGAQIKTVLEQQWQRDAAGEVPSDRSCASAPPEGFFATYDPTRPRATGSPACGSTASAIEAGTTVLRDGRTPSWATGGDNFREFGRGPRVRDTGKVDLQAMVDYMAAKAEDGPCRSS